MSSISYTVASAHKGTVTRTVSFGGADVEAQVPALIVECISADGGMGHSFSFIGAEASEAAQAVFEVGAKVTATFSKDAE